MYILTSKYFPTDYWPDLYFPALLDIQYTEVMEFTLAMPMLVSMEIYEELSL